MTGHHYEFGILFVEEKEKVLCSRCEGPLDQQGRGYFDFKFPVAIDPETKGPVCRDCIEKHGGPVATRIYREYAAAYINRDHSEANAFIMQRRQQGEQALIAARSASTAAQQARETFLSYVHGLAAQDLRLLPLRKKEMQAQAKLSEAVLFAAEKEAPLKSLRNPWYSQDALLRFEEIERANEKVKACAQALEKVKAEYREMFALIVAELIGEDIAALQSNVN